MPRSSSESKEPLQPEHVVLEGSSGSGDNSPREQVKRNGFLQPKSMLGEDEDAVEKSDREALVNKVLHHATFFLDSAWREMIKRKFNFCLGISSVFLVVLVSAVCFTIINKTPIIFLQQSESAEGQYDVQMVPESALFLNFSQVEINVRAQEEFSYITPRFSVLGQAYSPQCTESIDTVWGLDITESAWTYEGYPDTEDDGCSNTTMNCLGVFCSEARTAAVQMYAIDSQREARMGFGRNWPFPKLAPGETIIGPGLAAERGWAVGDTIFYSVNLENERLINTILAQAFDQNQGYDVNVTALLSATIARYARVVHLPFTIVGIYTKDAGKFGEAKIDFMATEYEHLLPYLVQRMHPIMHETDVQTLKSALYDSFQTDEAYSALAVETLTLSLADELVKPDSSDTSLYNFAKEVYLNLPPERVDVYVRTTNYDNVQNDVIGFVSRAMYYVGYPEVALRMKVLEGMQDRRFFALFLGLILSIILTILFVLSTMLLYSLLLISIETRAFEMGVHRMVGMTRVSLVQLIFVQALSYAIPAWILGLIISQLIVDQVLLGLGSGVPIDTALTPDAIAAATVLGILVPLIACILPIRVALSKNLYDTLDVRHSKTKAVKLEIERSEDKGFDVAWVIVSFGMVFFGFLVYYLLPLSLLSFNLTLFANIFFGILLGMLCGLILLSLNFEHITERLVTFLFLWWERSQIPALVLKNLVAHRVRNRKTTLMYALSIGFIIFITVSYRVEILTLQYSELKEHGAEMALEKQFTFISPAAVAPLEHLLVSGTYRDVVADFTWVTAGIGEWGYIDEAAVFSNLGNYKSAEIRIHGVSSNFFDVADDVFLIPAQSDTSTGESLSEQLYSIAGSQSVVFGSALQNSFFMAGLNAADKPSFLLQTQATDLQAESRASKMGTLGEASETLQRLYQYPLQPLAYLDSCPKFSASRFAEDDYSMVVSMPTFLSMTKGHFKSMRDVPMNSLLIKFHAEATDKQKDQLKLDLADAAAFSDVKVFDSRDLATVLETTDQVMTLIFGVATYIAMFLCLFSLVASMYTNIYEQTKEIAILRAMGMNSRQIVKLYVYEAFVLTLAASILGLMIGMVMAWTLTVQRALFTQLPIPFVFPWDFALLVIIGAGVCAMIAAYTPASRLMKKNVAAVMRTVL